MCLSFPVNITFTLQIDLNVILELVILCKYGNNRDYEVGSMSSNLRFLSLRLTVLVWTNVVKMLQIERWPSVVHWYAVPERAALSCNYVHTNWRTILHVIYPWVASLSTSHEWNFERPSALLRCQTQFRRSRGKYIHRGLWKWVRRQCYARHATSSMHTLSHDQQGVWAAD